MNDAATRPSAWVDAQDASTFTLDGSSRLVSWASKGSAASVAYTPPSTARAPLYINNGFNNALPAVQFSKSRTDLLSTAWNGPQQGCTVVYVWQEPASGNNNYCCLVDHTISQASGDGGRVSVFNSFNSTTNVSMHLIASSVASEHIALSNAYGRINVMIVEYNGANTRVYLNGVTTTYPSFSASFPLFGSGMTIGAKNGDTITTFNGVYCEFAAFPAVFTGDAWDRITQGTMWKWVQQANIASGATYKNAAPTVTQA